MNNNYFFKKCDIFRRFIKLRFTFHHWKNQNLTYQALKNHHNGIHKYSLHPFTMINTIFGVIS